MNTKASNDGIPSVAKFANLHFIRGLYVGGLSAGSAAGLIAGVVNRWSTVGIVSGVALCAALGLTYVFVSSIDGPDTNRF